MIGSVLLVFLPTFSPGFYILYLLCGFTDMIDGTVARKTNSASRFGEKLDTAADIVFVAAAPILDLYSPLFCFPIGRRKIQ